jgi:hypothetical protein
MKMMIICFAVLISLFSITWVVINIYKSGESIGIQECKKGLE